jgi:t-SNARE complex subunit (syntaxin)
VCAVCVCVCACVRVEVRQGVTELEKADEYSKKMYTLKCILCLLVLIAILIIVLVARKVSSD